MANYKVYLSDGLNLNMLNIKDSEPDVIRITKIGISRAKSTVSYAKRYNLFVSAVKNKKIADALSVILGTEIPVNRSEVKLDELDLLVVAQLKNKKIPKVLRKRDLKNLEFEFYFIELYFS